MRWRKSCASAAVAVAAMLLIAGPAMHSIAANQSVRLDQILAHRPHGRLGTIGDAHLSQNMLHVFLHCLVADAERLGDLFVREAERELLQHFALSLGE